MLLEISPPLALDLNCAVIRQGCFIGKIHNIDWVRSPTVVPTMNRLVQENKYFIQAYPTRIAGTTLDVNLAWHTHQLSKPGYYIYITSRTGKCIDGDDTLGKRNSAPRLSELSKPIRNCMESCTLKARAGTAKRFGERIFPVFPAFSCFRKEKIGSKLNSLPTASAQKHGPHVPGHNAFRPETLFDRAERKRVTQQKLKVRLLSKSFSSYM